MESTPIRDVLFRYRLDWDGDDEELEARFHTGGFDFKTGTLTIEKVMNERGPSVAGYRVRVSDSDGAVDEIVGGTYDTLSEAKDAAEKMLFAEFPDAVCLT